jgi:hypothetical protein
MQGHDFVRFNDRTRAAKSLEEVLDAFVAQFKSFRWRKLDNDIYLIEPSTKGDSEVDFETVAVRGSHSVTECLYRMLSEHKDRLRGGAWGMLTSGAGQKVIKLRIPRMKVVRAMVEGARQAGPSTWIVGKTIGYSWNVYGEVYGPRKDSGK